VRNCYLLTVLNTAKEMDMKRETVILILTNDLKLKKVCAKMVPENLGGEKQFPRTFQKDCWKNPTIWKK
jgi:hypothetical protein